MLHRFCARRPETGATLERYLIPNRQLPRFRPENLWIWHKEKTAEVSLDGLLDRLIVQLARVSPAPPAIRSLGELDVHRIAVFGADLEGDRPATDVTRSPVKVRLVGLVPIVLE